MADSGTFSRRNTKAAKLSLSQVQDIREAYAQGATQSALCRHYGVTVGTIGRIVRGETWVGQARPGEGTQAEIDESMARFAKMIGAETLADIPAAAERSHEEFLRRPPPSPLDGGDAPAEASGSGLSALQQRALAYGAANVMVDEIKGESK